MSHRLRRRLPTWDDTRGEFSQGRSPSPEASWEAAAMSRSLENVASSQAQLVNSLPSYQLQHNATEPPDEQQIWDQIQGVTAMPIPMEKKRERKRQLLNSPAFPIQGIQRLHLHRQKFWSSFKRMIANMFSFELWRGSLRLIEGNLGTGVLSYFHYIKKVMYMNMAVFAAMLAFVVLPNALLQRTEPLTCDLTDNTTVTSCCHADYTQYVHNHSWSGVTKGVMDLLQGTGFMELTPLFYGYYENVVLVGPSGLYYDLPLAYMLVSFSCLLLCLVFVVVHTAHGFQSAILSRRKFNQYSNAVLCAWDFSVDNARAGEYKQKTIHNELKGCLETDRYETERLNRSKLETIQLYVVRTIANALIIAILAFCGVIIFYVVQYSLVHVEEEAGGQNRAAWLTVYQYMPAMTVSGLNIVATLFMYHVVTLERYTPQVNVILTLVRTVCLRAASVAVLMCSFFAKYSSECEGNLEEFQCYIPGCDTRACWETIIGQTCYKLMLTDFACIAGISLLVYFPMKVMADHFPNKAWMRTIFVQEFQIPRHVLDVAYNQALSWLGLLYSPLLPGISAIICFLFFYLKRFTCTHICTAPTLSLHTIRSSAFYMLVSLFSFFAALLIVIFSLAEVRPSRSCGPFRGLDTMWMEIPTTVDSLPSWLRAILHFFASAGFAVPLLVALVLAVYLYSAMTAANERSADVLQDQLVLEGHNKRFLLNKLVSFSSAASPR